MHKPIMFAMLLQCNNNSIYEEAYFQILSCRTGVFDLSLNYQDVKIKLGAAMINSVIPDISEPVPKDLNLDVSMVFFTTKTCQEMKRTETSSINI